jgi:diaminopimelate decarboxylase
MLSDRDFQTLAEQFGTPLFVMEAAILKRQYQLLSDALPAGTKIHYSVKANPAPAVIAEFLAMGSGVEIASEGEGVWAIQAGASPRQILFAGPGKSEKELQWAVAQGVGQIHLESLTEVDMLERITQATGKRARVALRINPNATVAGGAMRMGGVPSPFGVDEEQLEHVLPRVEEAEGVDLIGIHQFAATQVLDADVLLKQWAHAIELGHLYQRILGRAPEVIDVGGGLGIALYDGDSPLDLTRLAAGCVELPALPQGSRLLVEPGRFLAGPAGSYLCAVRNVKESRGKTFVIVDGGMHHHLAASGNLGQVIKRDLPVRQLSETGRDFGGNPNPDGDGNANNASDQVAQICGPLCTPLDVIARQARVHQPQPGAIFLVEQSGAYAATASPMHFLSHPAPAEILIHADGRASVMRPAGDSRNLVPDYFAPPSQGNYLVPSERRRQ